MKHRCFVYGSLLKGLGNHHVLNGAAYLGVKAVELPCKLISLGSYPALVKTKELSKVYGESYLVDDEGLKRLDYLEGHPNFYRREQLEDGTWVYFLTEGCVPDVPIPVLSGSWREYYGDRVERRYGS